MTRNTLFSNTGLHTLDIHANSKLSVDKNTFFYNNFYDNLALGHGQQYLEMYGYQPAKENNEFFNRPRRDLVKRQVSQTRQVFYLNNEISRFSPSKEFHSTGGLMWTTRPPDTDPP